VRRVRGVVPPSQSSVVDSAGADEDESPAVGRKGAERVGGSRIERPRNRWWRPASTAGRVFFLLLALTALGGIAASGYILQNYLNHDERFRIAGADNIEVSGLTQVSRAEMLPVFGEDIGRNILFVPLSERRRQLEQIPWVERATVMRLLPDRIRVVVVERQPVAFVRRGDQIGLVDGSGVLLSMPPAMMAEHHYSFPVVTGIDAQLSPASRQERMKVYQRLMNELDANGQKLSEQISEIDLTDPADARVLMPEQGGDILAHFGEDRFLERYQRYKANIADWRKQYPQLASVDLRYETQAVLAMRPSADGAQVATVDDKSASAASDKPAVEKSADKTAEEPVAKAKAKPAKASAKPSKNGTAKSKSAAAKAKTAKMKAQQKKRAEAKRTAQNNNRQKIAPVSHPAAKTGLGQ